MVHYQVLPPPFTNTFYELSARWIHEINPPFRLVCRAEKEETVSKRLSTIFSTFKQQEAIISAPRCSVTSRRDLSGCPALMRPSVSQPVMLPRRAGGEPGRRNELEKRRRRTDGAEGSVCNGSPADLHASWSLPASQQQAVSEHVYPETT